MYWHRAQSVAREGCGERRKEQEIPKEIGGCCKTLGMGTRAKGRNYQSPRMSDILCYQINFYKTLVWSFINSSQFWLHNDTRHKPLCHRVDTECPSPYPAFSPRSLSGILGWMGVKKSQCKSHIQLFSGVWAWKKSLNIWDFNFSICSVPIWRVVPPMRQFCWACVFTWSFL